MHERSDRPVRPGSMLRKLFRLSLPCVIVSALFKVPLAVAQEAMTPSLVRRLAEATDGRWDTLVHWIVARRLPPHDIKDIFLARDSALPFVNAEFGAYGPFQKPPAAAFLSSLVFLRCEHKDNPISSIWRPAICPSLAIPRRQLLSLILVASFRTDTLPGTRPVAADTVDLIREGVDALFLTASSIRKFVIPYYSQLHGPAYAEMLWDSVTTRARLIVR